MNNQTDDPIAANNKQFAHDLESLENKFGNHFVASQSITQTKGKLDTLTIFSWCDELYIVESAFEQTGVVRCIDGSMASSNWRWNYQNEQSTELGKLSQSAFDQLINRL